MKPDTQDSVKRFREMTDKTGEENDWNFDDLVDDAEAFLVEEIRKGKLEERQKIGVQFFEWFYLENSEEMIEEAIERITGVKYMGRTKFEEFKHSLSSEQGEKEGK